MLADYYWSDYDTNPEWWVYRADKGEDHLEVSITAFDSGEVIDLVWEQFDVSPRKVTPTPDRSDPETKTWLTGALGPWACKGGYFCTRFRQHKRRSRGHGL